MNQPISSREAIDRMTRFTPEDLIRMCGRGQSTADPEIRVVHRAHYDRIVLEREQAIEKVKSLEEQCEELRTARTAKMLRAAGWPLVTILTAVCTYFLAR